mmetsp:Transcript_17565/g.30141  ORF Transcript_17565/g.30141 Transcript_17565/m.30141 type:complete len:180 (+) Transcript_17565:90-629(+)|eukprot:CAMPEP_0119104282 /NCGR_PEP_ID=MMETSP1180-20130426/2524_1 /TAXON_ID=3052 ORGANISM="Chlamydomonas cf sp, Strain CCMP681" /NCGR_SAMPLE_ID=MMETSP1180 /ASSEMBLY_ACC=CAM_ASM_000741 /LENGTH=179 /DNA_ID=CAMNT_0007088987 /DNA_START=75 /DNA_END=614 /DNA_ORIENTATION=-
MRKLHIHPVGLGLLVCGFLSWIVALGGLAATTQFCRTQPDATGSDGSSLSLSVSCAQQYQGEWWSIWFEFFLLVIMFGTCFVNAFDRARFIYLAYLSLVTVLLTQTATNFSTDSFKLHAGTIVYKDTKQSALNAAAAGTVLMCICNYALIIFVGLGAAAAQQGGLHLNSPETKYQPSNF